MVEQTQTPNAELADLGAAIAEAAGPAVQEAFLERGVELVLRATRAGLLPLMTLLRDDPRLRFEQLMDLCGMDWPERAERFEVVYNLLSLAHNRRIRVIVSTDENTPVPSVGGIWVAAGWYEREAWDMYGILFEGQVDLRRLLTDYGFEGHPLRKDYPVQAKQPRIPLRAPEVENTARRMQRPDLVTIRSRKNSAGNSEQKTA